MKKVKVTRRMLESYVRDLLMEKSVPTRAAITYQASPSQTQRVLASVFSGGTDFGQAFEEICMQMLRVNGFSNVSDLNPTETYSVEDGEGTENKSSDQNAELADTIIFDNAYTGNPVPGEVTIDQLPNVILLSAKANKGPKAFIGNVTKLRSKLKKLLQNRVLNKATELSKQTDQLNVRLGTINIALNPRLSLQQEAAIYDVLISMPNVPNLGVVGISDEAIQALQQAKEDVNAPRFQTQFLPTVLKGIPINKSMGKLGQIINMASDSANPVFTVQSSTSFTREDNKTRKQMFVNPLAASDVKASYTKSLQLVQRSEKGGPDIPTRTVTDQLSVDQRTSLYETLKNNEFNTLMDTYSTNIANQFVNALQASIDNHNAAVIQYKKDRGTFYQVLNAQTTDETTNQLQFEAYINQLFLKNVPQTVIDAAEKLKDVAQYKKIEGDTPTWKLTSVRKLAKRRSNKAPVSDKEFADAKEAYNKAIRDAKVALKISLLQSAGFSIDQYNSENTRGKWMTNTEFKNSTSGYANTVSQIMKDTIAEKDYLVYDVDTQEITIISLEEVKSDIKGIILEHFGSFDSPGYNDFFINLSAYSIINDNNQSSGYFATATSQNAVVNPDEFITIGEKGFLSSHLNSTAVSQLLNDRVKTDVYLLDPNQNPIYSPKDSSSNYYNFHNSFVSQVPNTQLYFQVKLDLGNYAINDETVKADIVRKYNEVVLKNNPLKIKAFKTQALETEERLNWGKLSALTFVSALVDATLRTSEYTDPGTYPPQRKEPEFEIGTDEEGREGYEYPRPISKDEMFQLKEDMDAKILELQTALGTYVSIPAAQVLNDFMKSIAERNAALGLSDMAIMTRQEALTISILASLVAEQLPTNLPSTPPIQKENLSRDTKYTVGQLYEIIISFCGHMIKLIDQDKRDEVLGVLEKLSKHIPKLKSALEKEEPGFFSRLGSRFMQGVEDISGRVGQAVDDLGRVLTPQQLATLREQKLYESILLDLMEASAKKQRAAQQPKKIKITKRQLNRLLEASLKNTNPIVAKLDKLLSSSDESDFRQGLMIASALVQDNPDFEQMQAVRGLVKRHHNRLVNEYNTLKRDIKRMVEKRKVYLSKTRITGHWHDQATEEALEKAREGMWYIDRELPKLREKLNDLEVLIQSVIDDVFYE